MDFYKSKLLAFICKTMYLMKTMGFNFFKLTVLLPIVLYSIISPYTSMGHDLHEWLEDKQSPTEMTIGPVPVGAPGVGDTCPHGIFQGKIERNKKNSKKKKKKNQTETIDG